MPTGIVKWFDNKKGFGFVRQDGGGKDVYVHQSAIHPGGAQALKGRKVSFEICAGPKGKPNRARNVKLIA